MPNMNTTDKMIKAISINRLTPGEKNKFGSYSTLVINFDGKIFAVACKDESKQKISVRGLDPKKNLHPVALNTLCNYARSIGF